jgi:hypothetical protein
MPLDPPEAAEQILPAQHKSLCPNQRTLAIKLVLAHGRYFIPLNSHTNTLSNDDGTRACRRGQHFKHASVSFSLILSFPPAPFVRLCFFFFLDIADSSTTHW